MAIYELNATHPFLSKRVAALRTAKGFASRAAARRPVLAYPLAPVLGIAAGGPVVSSCWSPTRPSSRRCQS